MFVPVPGHDMNFKHHMPWSLFVFSHSRRDLIVYFVDISEIVDHSCLHFLFNSCTKSRILFCFTAKPSIHIAPINADIVRGQSLYIIKHIILFYRKSINRLYCYKCRCCWRSEQHHSMPYITFIIYYRSVLTYTGQLHHVNVCYW
jgi:hypothetical protein